MHHQTPLLSTGMESGMEWDPISAFMKGRKVRSQLSLAFVRCGGANSDGSLIGVTLLSGIFPPSGGAARLKAMGTALREARLAHFHLPSLECCSII